MTYLSLLLTGMTATLLLGLASGASVAFQGFGGPLPNYPQWRVPSLHPNISCILFDGRLEFLVKYDTVDGQTNTAVIKIPSSSSASGSCEHKVQKLTINWETPANEIKFVFVRNLPGSDDMRYYTLQSILGQIFTNTVQFPNAANPEKVYQFSTQRKLGFMSDFLKLNLSYFCLEPYVVYFDNSAVELKLSHVHAKAFNDVPNYDQYPSGLPMDSDGSDFGPRSNNNATQLTPADTVATLTIMLERLLLYKTRSLHARIFIAITSMCNLCYRAIIRLPFRDHTLNRVLDSRSYC